MTASRTRPARPARCIGLALVLAALVASCSVLSPSTTEEWVESEVGTRSEQVLWEVALLSLDKAGFPVGMGADPAARRIETGWQRSLAPFKGAGWREKATIQYERLPDRRYEVKVRVERETNESLRPLDPSFAKWTPRDDNAARARIILQYLQGYLGDEIEVGEKPSPTSRD